LIEVELDWLKAGKYERSFDSVQGAWGQAPAGFGVEDDEDSRKWVAHGMVGRLRSV
jgi:hypothetical protein